MIARQSERFRTDRVNGKGALTDRVRNALSSMLNEVSVSDVIGMIMVRDVTFKGKWDEMTEHYERQKIRFGHFPTYVKQATEALKKIRAVAVTEARFEDSGVDFAEHIGYTRFVARLPSQRIQSAYAPD